MANSIFAECEPIAFQKYYEFSIKIVKRYVIILPVAGCILSVGDCLFTPCSGYPRIHSSNILKSDGDQSLEEPESKNSYQFFKQSL